MASLQELLDAAGSAPAAPPPTGAPDAGTPAPPPAPASSEPAAGGLRDLLTAATQPPPAPPAPEQTTQPTGDPGLLDTQVAGQSAGDWISQIAAGATWPTSALLRGEMELPDFSGVPAWTQAAASQVPNFAAGFLSVPVDVADQALKLLGTDGVLPSGQDGMNAINAAFQTVGVPIEATEGMAARIGRDTFVGLMALGAMFAAAPTLASTAGMTTTALISRELSQFMLKHPATATAIETAASAAGAPGAEYGGTIGAWLDDLAGSDKRIGERVGATAGSIVTATTAGGTAASMARGARAVAAAPGKALTLVDAQLRPGPPEAPIRDPNIAPRDFTAFAERAIDVDRQALNDEIRSVLQRAQQTENVDEISSRFIRELQPVHARVRAKEEEYWNQVGLGEDADVLLENAGDAARQVADEVGLGTPGFPTWIARRIRMLAQHEELEGTDPATGDAVVTEGELLPATYGQVRHLRTQIREFQGDLQRKGQWASARKLEPIMDALTNDIDAAAVAHGADPRALEVARAYTRYRAELFNDGPIGKVLSWDSNQNLAVQPIDALRQIENMVGGHEQIQRIAREQQAPELERTVTEWVQRQFQDAAELGALNSVETGGLMEGAARSKSARDYMKRNEGLIKRLGQAGADMHLAFDELRGLQNATDDLNKSALMRASKRTHEEIGESIFSSPDPEREVAVLLHRIGGDRNARLQLEATLIGRLWKRSGESVNVRTGVGGTTMVEPTVRPSAVRAMMNDDRIGSALRMALGPDKYNRLREMVDLGVRLEKGDEKTWRQLYKSGARVIARVMGAQFGRQVGKITGGGTVQTPGITAGVAKNLVEGLFDPRSAGDLLTRAIVDPSFGAILRSRVPSTPGELVELTRKFKRSAAYLEGVRGALGLHYKEREDRDQR